VSKILIPSRGAEDWQRLLAEPAKHWRSGYSAKALAHCWEAADGFPPSVQAIFDGSRFEAFHGLELVLGIPEHRVPLPGGRRASQTDLFVLARANDGLVAIAVEGKVAEPFGPLVREWIAPTPSFVEGEPDVAPSEGKRERLAFLSSSLGLAADDVADARYQLVHRSVSALIEARRFAARHAVMLVHSFSERDDSFVPLYLGWATGDRTYLAL
jgi:hypothetical protein